MVIYALLDEYNFLEGWSSSEIEGSIPLEEDVLTDEIKNSFSKYRYDKESNSFILDESQFFEKLKNEIFERFSRTLIEKNEYGFTVNLEKEYLRYKNTEANKGFLQKAYSMKESGLIDETTLKFIDSEDNEVTRLVKGNNIYEIWILSFLHEDGLNRHFNENILPMIEKAKTADELQAITWESKV